MWRALILLALLAAPPAAAEAPVSLRLTSAEGLAARGDVRLSAPHAIVNLSDEAIAGAVEVRWREALGYSVTFEREAPLGGQVRVRDPARNNTTLHLGPGSLRLSGCVAPCQVVVVAAPGAEVTASGVPEGPLAVAGEGRGYIANFGSWGPDSFRALVGEEWVHVGLQGAALHARGRLVLFLDGPEGEFREEGRAEPFWTGMRTREGRALAGVAVTEVQTRRFIALVLEDAEVVAPRLDTAQLDAPAVEARVRGSLLARNATGTLDYGGVAVPLHDADAEVWGDVQGLVAARDGGGAGLLWRADVDGSATRMTLGGVDVRPVTPGASLAADLARWAALLLLLGVLAKACAWALYSRLGAREVLENANRRAVFDALAQAPGSRPAEVARITGIHEAVVRYHLRRLREAGFVRAEEAGAATLWFAQGLVTSPPLEAVLARRGVQGETARRLAAALLAFPAGATQLEVARATGVSRRLVSYHLQRLEEAALVTKRAGRPARFEPTPALRDALAGAPAE